jgi:pyrroline-5-carboxylate reductase
MRCGFIGYGNMGGAVVRALLGDGSLRESEVIVYNRTASRLESLRTCFPQVRIAGSMREAASNVDALFICVHTPVVPEVLSEIDGSVASGTHLVTINGGIGIADIESSYDGAVSKVIPSISIEVGRGFTLISHGRKVSGAQASALESLFSRSGRVKVLPEEKLGIATDLTSCGPGFMAEMIAQFALSGAKAGSIDDHEAIEMATETMLGTALMMADGRSSPDALAERVATKGGITEQGLLVLERDLPRVFDQMFEATRRKRGSVRTAMAGMSDH